VTRVLMFLLVASHANAMVIDPVDPGYGIALIELPRPLNAQIGRVYGLVVLPDGGVVAATTTEQSDPIGCYAATLYWRTPGGATAGSRIVVPCTTGTVGLAGASDGSLYLQGAEGPIGSPGPQRVWKLRADGTVDASFAGTIPIVESFARPTVEVLSDGTVAVGGTATLLRAGTPYYALVVAHLRPDGAADPTFGVQGVAIAEPPNRPIFGQEGGGMVHNADGSVLVAGNIFEDDAGAKIYTDAAVARFDARGRLDVGYGQGGFAIPVPDASTYVQRLAARNGEAYVAVVQNRDSVSAFVAKLRANGTLDLGYGVAGIAEIDDYRNSNFHPLIAVDSQGRAYVQYLDKAIRSKIARLDAGGARDPSFGLGGAAYLAADGWALTGAGELVIGGDRTFLATGTFMHDGVSLRTGFAVTRLASSGGYRAEVTGGKAIIYYNAGLDHYFLTGNPAEQVLLDNGVTKGWQRTGTSFGVVTSAIGDADLTPVCRYYGRPEAHLDSHFFSAAPDECAAVAVKFGASWILETNAAFYVHPADRITGQCVRGSERVFRAFNNRADANHYYDIVANKPAGWTYEGYGPASLPTAFCAPLL
jgi:uncharacterized delta-60 repeat protein